MPSQPSHHAASVPAGVAYAVAVRHGASCDDTGSRRRPRLRRSGDLADDRYEEFDHDDTAVGDAPVDEPTREERSDDSAAAIDEPGAADPAGEP